MEIGEAVRGRGKLSPLFISIHAPREGSDLFWIDSDTHT